MNRTILATIDQSRFPGQARAAYLESFRTRRMDHQFHYESERQAQLWLAIHEAYSPARNDSNCLDTYRAAFRDTASLLGKSAVSLISLGCGGGQKDEALATELKNLKVYVGADGSLPLTVGACLRVHAPRVQPVVVDLARVQDLPGLLDPLIPKNSKRLFAFFGMLPNFEPTAAFRPILEAIRPADCLLFSANLAPGSNYRKGVEAVLPQYDNPPTRRWLTAVLQDAGLDAEPSNLEYRIATVAGLFRIEVHYPFRKREVISLDGEKFQFKNGERFRLFFSYRHTPATVRALVGKLGLSLSKAWVSAVGDEGVFLCKRHLRLGELLSKVTPENVHPPFDWGPDVGKEVIEPYVGPESARRERQAKK